MLLVGTANVNWSLLSTSNSVVRLGIMGLVPIGSPATPSNNTNCMFFTIRWWVDSAALCFLRRDQLTLIRSFPKLRPASIPMNASGALSKPDTISSRYLIRPEAILGASSLMNPS